MCQTIPVNWPISKLIEELVLFLSNICYSAECQHFSGCQVFVLRTNILVI